MNDPEEAVGQAALSPRVALLSILGFWLFYFLIVSVRSAVLDLGYSWDVLGRRTIVTVVSAGVTLLLYLALRRIPRRSLGLSVAMAALLSLPAAILYSTVNFYAFRAISERQDAAKTRSSKTIVIETRRATATPTAPVAPAPSLPTQAVPPPPAVPHGTIDVHVEDAQGHRSEPNVTVGEDPAAASAERAAERIAEAAERRADRIAGAQDRIAEAQDRIAEARIRLAERTAEAAERAAEAVSRASVPLDANRRIMVQVGGGGDDETTNALKAIADNAANGYFFIAAWAALYLAMCYAAETRVAERRAARFRAAAQAAEIRALRYQVNPHFLFNTLNSLSSLVMTGRAEAAERMILNLSTFFRTSLTGDPAEDMRLDDEIRLQRLYLDIEAVRFPDRLVVAVDVPPALADACVPGLILQPLVENAVKYGVSRARRPVTIRIVAREADGRMRLRVEDDGDPLPVDAGGQGTGVGLRNVRDRVAARFGEAGICKWGPRPGGGFAVTLDLPLVRHDC